MTLLAAGSILPAWASHIPQEQVSSAALTASPDQETSNPEDQAPSEKPLPRGEIAKVTPGKNVIFILYLPMLPIIDKNGWYSGDLLKSLRIERSYADDPNTWSEYATLKWDSSSFYFYAVDSESESGFNSNVRIPPPYYDNFCTVVCNENQSEYRDFFLRATATTVVDGGLEEKTYGPALFAFPESMKPAPDDPPATKPADPSDGSAGGNRGNVTPGTSNRVDPDSSPADLLPSIEKAEASEVNDPTSSSEQNDGNNATNKGDQTPPKNSVEIPTNAGNPTPVTSSNSPAEHSPGFLIAIVVTATAIAVAVTTMAFRKSIMKRLSKRRS